MALLAPKRPQDFSESEFDALVFRNADSIAKTLGWLTYHPLKSRGSVHGYPDRTMVRDRVIFAELKTEKGKPTPEQVTWLDRLAKGGAEVYLWRPSDLDEIGRILGGMWRPAKAFAGPLPERMQKPVLQRWERTGGVSSVRESWFPGSAWVPGEGRADAR